MTDEGYLPSVFPFLAAIAAQTTTIRLGSAVLLAPFHHPIDSPRMPRSSTS